MGFKTPIEVKIYRAQLSPDSHSERREGNWAKTCKRLSPGPERDSGTVHVMSQKRLRVRAYALRYLRTNLSLNADVSENTLPFVSQSINNFSDYDVSQSHDWECPSLSPHVPLEITGEAATVLGVKLGRVPVLIQLVERLPNIASN